MLLGEVVMGRFFKKYLFVPVVFVFCMAVLLAYSLLSYPALWGQGIGVAAEQPFFTEDQQGDKININTATVAELTALPTIGEKKAQAIVDYRQLYGPFTSLEQVGEVPGIGEKTLQKIIEYICI